MRVSMFGGILQMLGVEGCAPFESVATAFHYGSYPIDYSRLINGTGTTDKASTAVGIEMHNMSSVTKDRDVRIVGCNYRLSTVGACYDRLYQRANYERIIKIIFRLIQV